MTHKRCAGFCGLRCISYREDLFQFYVIVLAEDRLLDLFAEQSKNELIPEADIKIFVELARDGEFPQRCKVLVCSFSLFLLPAHEFEAFRKNLRGRYEVVAEEFKQIICILFLKVKWSHETLEKSARGESDG